MLRSGDSALLIIDVQTKLAPLMHGKESLIENIRRMILSCRALEIPMIWAEQNPKGLGPTIPEVSGIMDDLEPIEKMTFSCCGSREFMRKLESVGRKQILVCGIETHVCIYQTAMDLLRLGYDVHVVADAVSSRTATNREVALNKIRDLGASITSTETALFEIVRVARGPKFKEILRIVK